MEVEFGGNECSSSGTGIHARLLPVARYTLALQRRTRPILATDGVVNHFFTGHRMNGVQNFGLFVAHIIGMEGDRRLHRREAAWLHDVIPHPVSQPSPPFVMASHSF